MGGIERAQISDMELLTMFPNTTQADTLADLRYMAYCLPAEDVEEMLCVIQEGVDNK